MSRVIFFLISSANHNVDASNCWYTRRQNKTLTGPHDTGGRQNQPDEPSIFCPSTQTTIALSHNVWFEIQRLCLNITLTSPFMWVTLFIFLIDTLTDRMKRGTLSPLKVSITIDTMLNFDSAFDGRGNGYVACKQTLNVFTWLVSVWFLPISFIAMVNRCFCLFSFPAKQGNTAHCSTHTDIQCRTRLVLVVIPN